jgi:hypothetical protein
MLQLVGYLLVGRLLVFILQKFPFQKIKFLAGSFQEGKFLKELFGCDLCLGCWVFWCLAFLIDMDFIYQMFNIHIVFFSYLFTGIIASFIVHVFRIGWTTKFGIYMEY